MVVFTVSILYEGPQYGFNSLYLYPRNQQIPKVHLMPIPATEEPFIKRNIKMIHAFHDEWITKTCHVVIQN